MEAAVAPAKARLVLKSARDYVITASSGMSWLDVMSYREAGYEAQGVRLELLPAITK